MVNGLSGGLPTGKKVIIIGDREDISGAALGLDVYHICEPQVKEHIDETTYAEQVEMMEMMLDIDEIIEELEAVRGW